MQQYLSHKSAKALAEGVALGVALVGMQPAQADIILTEDFEAPFEEWETGWLGTNSNLQNFYVTYGYPETYQGNNPDGLWLTDGIYDGPANILFDPTFGSTLTSFAVDVASYTNTDLHVFDMLGQTILNTAVVPTFGALTDPGVYNHYSVSSTNGISGFTFTSTGAEGNVSIDNVQVTVADANTTAVPEPGTWAMMAIVMAAVAFLQLRNKREEGFGNFSA